ncbi:MAG: gliding motility-associated C-terminal domain-containing protein [Bacteroidetes bacterium]|nr:gliding motility-associated C-terminal domain-containing protein [Bacteroidota bacterium]MBS1757303.1 gliding motility-associated C-terminal domain-containing protein [Bacteroidota bacterium]
MKIIKIKYIFLILVLLSSKYIYAQPNGCIDINNRIIYSLPLNTSLYVSPLTSSTSILMGGYEDINDSGIVVSKCYYDSIIWIKKYKSNQKNIVFSKAILLPDNSLLTIPTGYPNSKELFIARFNNNGNTIWAKKFHSVIPNSIISPNQSNNSIVYKDNYLYLSTIFNSSIHINENYNLITKLDLDGNPVWTTTLATNYPVVTFKSNPISIEGDTVTVVSNTSYFSNAGNIDSQATIITRLNANNGTLLSNAKIRIVPDDYIKGLTVFNAKIFEDNSIWLKGSANFLYPNNGGIVIYSSNPFILKLDANYNTVLAKYFTTASAMRISHVEFNCTNNNKKTGFLFEDIQNQLQYTCIIDSSLFISQTRAFLPNNYASLSGGQSFNLDDNNCAIYGYNRFNGNTNKSELEYFRINQFAPAKTLSCFGRDTSFFTPHVFSTQKDSFKWDQQFSSLLIQGSYNLIEEPVTMDAETVCTQKSICDTIKVKGDNCYNLSNPNASFTLYKNPQCLRQTKWLIDTTAIKIISQSNDSTINVQFLKPYHGYIKATFEGCTLKDSLYISVYPPTPKLWLGEDTIYCPSKPIILHAGTGFKTYKWQDNSSLNFFAINKPGIYFVTVTDSCNNTLSDTITIKPLDDQLSLSYPNTLCLYDTASIILNNRFTNYMWSPADAGVIQNNTLKLFPTQSTIFNISAQAFTGCSISDTTFVKVEECPTYFYIPNAFTPNNDGLNDIFKPIITGTLAEYHFEIYNRFGQKIFATKKINEGWNGTIKGISQNTGIYIWLCTYKFRNKQVVFKKGTILLIR